MTPQQDPYAELDGLAGLFDGVGRELQERSLLGRHVLADEDFSASEPLSPRTWAEAEEAVRRATTGNQGLATRAVELDADALVVRATVLTYRWIDELRERAEQRFAHVVSRALGYLAPEVELGGRLVQAGLIETDATDREDVAAYLGELAEEHPELFEHVSTGGGLLDSLQLRSLLTVAALSDDAGPRVARGGLLACGVEPLRGDATGALRDLAGTLGEQQDQSPEPATGPTGPVGGTVPAGTTAAGSGAGPPAEATAGDPGAPHSVTALLSGLRRAANPVTVQRIDDGHLIAYLPDRSDPTGDGGAGDGAAGDGAAGDGAAGAPERRLRLVGGARSVSADTRAVLTALDHELAEQPGGRVMLVGAGSGAVTAAEVAAGSADREYVVEQLVTVGSPGSHAARLPETIRVLALEDRANPVALLGSLVNAGESHRVTVVFDGAGASGTELSAVGGQAVDEADHPVLRAEVERLQSLGYLVE